ncbi:MAG: transposase [Candidatus Zixiibacteriota bacterium]|nr:MAG: transposase [candidate division Zixibacteria bacterium]
MFKLVWTCRDLLLSSMGRRKRFNHPGHAHELTFSCYKNRPFLANLRYCSLLADAIEACRYRYSFWLWAYVFMPNHVHLLVLPWIASYDIAEILQGIKQSVSRKVMIEARKTGSHQLRQFSTGSGTRPYRFWQAGGGYDRNIVSREALMRTIDYIHNNPLRAGLVDAPEEWQWSSFRDWAGLGSGPLHIDKETMSLF